MICMKPKDAAKLKKFELVKKQKTYPEPETYPEEIVLPEDGPYLYLYQSSKHKSNDSC